MTLSSNTKERWAERCQAFWFCALLPFRFDKFGSTHYLRNRTDTAPYLESFYYERDPPFSITCDYKMVSLIIENSPEVRRSYWRSLLDFQIGSDYIF